MEHKRAKMPASQRAKQFMPFSAVKGLEKALREQEEKSKRVEQIEFGEERIQEINRELHRFEKGCKVSVCFYNAGQYKTLQGIVEQIDPTRGVLKVSGVAIVFEDIAQIKKDILKIGAG